MTNLLPFKPVILWTDALVFLLVAVILVFGWYVRRHEHLLAPWRKVGAQPQRHGRCGGPGRVRRGRAARFAALSPAPGGRCCRRQSQLFRRGAVVFDVVASHLRTQARENLLGAAGGPSVLQGDGGTAGRHGRRGEFPRLTYGGAHLDGSGDRLGVPTCAKRAIAGVAIAVLAWNLLTTDRDHLAVAARQARVWRTPGGRSGVAAARCRGGRC